MSHLHPQHIESFDPFVPEKTSLFNKLGNKLGSIFVSAKKAATEKYLELTQGINQRIEAEDERIQEEIDFHLAAQAEEFEQEMQQQKKRWIRISVSLTFAAFCIGAASSFFYLIQ